MVTGTACLHAQTKRRHGVLKKFGNVKRRCRQAVDKENLKPRKEKEKRFLQSGFVLSSHFTKRKEVFMQSTDYSWKPSVGIA
jgi:hypothetical protein